MKSLLIGVLSFVCGCLVVAFFFSHQQQQPVAQLIVQTTPLPTPLSVYSFDHLSQLRATPSAIVLDDVLDETPQSRRQLFHFSLSPRPGSDERKIVSGVINLPKEPGNYPVIVMMRGYVPVESYKPGAGTQPAASVFVKNGFITIAPDFLGFGSSSPRSDDPYEARFQTYTTALSLVSSLSTLNSALSSSGSGQIQAYPSHVGIWGHSNGGHIALATLAISRLPYPTVLWAPVSKSFPYSVLAYTDEDDDGGKAEREDLSEFESHYDTDLFNPAKYYDRILAPLQIHQGTADEEVPVWWTNEFVKNMRGLGKEIEYHTYPGSDHNLRPAWNDVVLSSLDFYKKQFSK